MKRFLMAFLLGILTFGAMAQDDYFSRPYTYMYEKYNKPMKVKGGAGIVQFMNAIGEADGFGWDENAIFDKSNGYFEYDFEGDGGEHLRAAYWNRTDGKKMFIFSFLFSETRPVKYTASIVRTNDWYKVRTCNLPDDNEYALVAESGIVAYLYNAATQTLEPMKVCPFNNVPKTDEIMWFQPPRYGKDIKVEQYNLKTEDNRTTHTLKFNGTTFDWVK